MNAKMILRPVQLALAAGLLAGTALAQQEQWLTYRTSTEPRGYRWLELSTNAPANVALPKLQPGAYFGCWTNGMDGTNAGRWYCLDRARKSGPCDRLFFDSNGNGRLDDEAPFASTRRDEMMAYFDPIKIVFKGEDGPVSYHLIVRFYQLDQERAQLLAGAGGWYEGNVTLGGKKQRVQVFDNTVNGAFNDQGANAAESDRIVVAGDRSVDRYLGRYLEVNGQLMRLEVARDGACLKVQKAEGVTYGMVRVPEAISEFIAVGLNGHFVRKPAKGQLTLPVGTYRVQDWTIERKDDKGVAWTLSGSGFGKGAEFEVAAAEPTVLSVGEPIRAVLLATESKAQITFNLRLQGSLGETVEIMRGTERPRAPQLSIASVKGSYRVNTNFEYG